MDNQNKFDSMQRHMRVVDISRKNILSYIRKFDSANSELVSIKESMIEFIDHNIVKTEDYRLKHISSLNHSPQTLDEIECPVKNYAKLLIELNSLYVINQQAIKTFHSCLVNRASYNMKNLF